MYNKIVNPRTGRKININSPLAKKILKKYLEGGSTTKEEEINLSGFKFHLSELDRLLLDPKLHPIDALNKITKWVCNKMNVDTEYIKTLVDSSNMFHLIQDGGSGRKTFLFDEHRANDPEERMLQRRASQEIGHTDPSIIASQERAFMAKLERDRTRMGPDGLPRLQRTLNAPGQLHGPGNVHSKLNMLASTLDELESEMMAERAIREEQEHRLQRTHRNTDLPGVDPRISVLKGFYGQNVPRSERWRFRHDLKTEKIEQLIEDGIIGRYQPVGSFGAMASQWLVLIILFIFLVWFTGSNFFSINPRD